jgi:hypothetical protein
MNPHPRRTPGNPERIKKMCFETSFPLPFLVLFYYTYVTFILIFLLISNLKYVSSWKLGRHTKKTSLSTQPIKRNPMIQ